MGIPFKVSFLFAYAQCYRNSFMLLPVCIPTVCMVWSLNEYMEHAVIFFRFILSICIEDTFMQLLNTAMIECLYFGGKSGLFAAVDMQGTKKGEAEEEEEEEESCSLHG